MSKAYSYIRFSTPEQAKGDSLRRQTDRTEEWCAKRGVTLDDTLHDFGVSAFKGANRTTGALRRFLELVESGRIERGSYLIVESLDRLSREAVMDAASRLFDLIRAGVTVVTLSDGQEYSHERLVNDWTPLVFSLVVMARAHEESKVKSERVAAAWKQKKILARSEGKPLTRRCPGWLKLCDGQFIERPDQVALVRRVFRETIDGLGRREIVRRLNAEGVPPFRRGKGWQTSSIAKIIQSRTVLGEYQPHTGTHKAKNRMPEGDPIQGYYPRIIDDETFWRAQAATQNRRQRTAGRKGNAVHLLQGLARCGSCGNPMHIINKGRPPKGGIYLCCSNSMRSAGCSNARRWRVDRLEKAILKGLDHLDREALAPLDSTSPTLAAHTAALQARIADAKARRTRLLALVESGDDEAVARFNSVAKEVRILKNKLQAAEEKVALLAADPGLATRLADVATLSRHIDQPNVEARRDLRIRLAEILRGVVERVDCENEVGAILVLRPIPLPLRMRKNVSAPYAWRAEYDEDEKAMYYEILVEDDADTIAINQFLNAGDFGNSDVLDLSVHTLDNMPEVKS